MATLGSSPPSLYRAYGSLLWSQERMFGAWPPIVNNIKLGTYGSLDSNGFTPLGTVMDLAGITLPPPSATSQSLGFCLSSEKMSSQAYSITANAEVPVDDVGLVSGNAVIKYTSSTNVGLTVAVDAMTRTDISSDVEDWLRQTLLPAITLLSKGSWNGDWRVVCSVFTTDAYAFAGGSGSNTAFNFSATGSVLGEMGKGSLTATIDIDQVSNVSDSESSANLNPPAVIGLELWHFSKEQPHPDTFT